MSKHMPTLDLHHLPHEEVASKVIEFINFLDPPFRIITGNSDTMRKIVIDIVENYNWSYHKEYFQNYGCLIIMDKKNV